MILEAGGRHEIQDFQNDEWGSFGQISWLDKRTTSGSWRVAKDFSGLPAWIVKSVGGTTQHWAGASLRFQEHEWKAATTYGNVQGASLLDWPIDAAEMDKIIGFPLDIKGQFDGPTLFLSGANSDYVRPEHRERIKALFPAAKFAKIPGAGHWLHAEKPREFEAAVRAFLES